MGLPDREDRPGVRLAGVPGPPDRCPGPDRPRRPARRDDPRVRRGDAQRPADRPGYRPALNVAAGRIP